MYMYGMEFVLLEIYLPIVRINGFCVQNREKQRFFMKKKLADLIPLRRFWNIFK